MSSSTCQLKIRLTWILPDSEQNSDRFLCAYHDYFERHVAELNKGETYEIGDVQRKPRKNFYEEQTYFADAVLNAGGVEWFGAHSRFARLGESWCDLGRQNKGVFQWLTPLDNEAFPRSRHPTDWEVNLSSLTFGTLYGLDGFIEHQKFTRKPTDGHRDYRLTARFQHDQKVLYLDLHLNHKDCSETVSNYRFVTAYQNILKVLVCKKKNSTEIFFHLKSPAMLMGEAPCFEDNSKSGKIRWERYLTLGCRCIGGKVDVRSLCGGLVVKLSLRDGPLAHRLLGRLSQRCAVAIHFCPVRTLACDTARARAVHEGCEAMQRQLPFPCAYAFKSVLLITFDVLDQMSLLPEDKFGMLMESLPNRALQSSVALERALSHIMTSIDAGNVVLFHHAIEATFNHFLAAPPAPLARGTCLVRSIFITPGRLILRPLQIHFENRVLREFNAEYALRASFRDDNLSKLSFTLHLHSSRDAILDVIVGRMMRDGLKVGFRVFKFLAASPSQLRDHGAWMYAEDEHSNSASTIRTWMGHFEDIRNVAKRMARMGQCFSSTEQAVYVPGSQVKEVPDVVGGTHPISKKPYVFSDGVGMMSVALAKEVYKELKLQEEPSALQIRYAGAKGMLCINPELPDTKLLCLRPSMKKFPCTNSRYLEVIKVSAPRVVTLNRPLITILEQLGVSVEVFLRLQEDMILEYTDALVSEKNAIEMLSTMAKLPLPFRDLSHAGYMLTQDPFFRSMLLAVYKSAVAGLRYKTRIALPVNRARNMLGVMDTTNTLEYGQVFVQYTEMGSHVTEPAPKHVVSGTVVVTKCPCLHPGDVRRLTAVDVPRLHHVVDCVVFPAKGPRPHPDEMAGSDLDGDEYVVIWDARLSFPSNKKPMNFSDRNVQQRNGEITIDDMIKFLCDYIKNDAIGVLSNAHLAWADQEPDGIYSPRCLSIAEKVSTCLDFAKTGRTAFLRRDERPVMYPDFMEKGDHKMSYRSNRALGQLYRACRSLEAAVGMSGRCHTGSVAALEVPGWERYRSSANAALEQYNFQLSRILRQYGMNSEGEAMAGAINLFDHYHNATTDKLNMEDLVEKLTRFIKETTRNVFFDELKAELEKEGVCPGGEQVLRKFQKASAWYMAVYGKDAVETTYYSFPWCISDVLVEILQFSDTNAGQHYNNTLAKLVDEMLANNYDDVCARWDDKVELKPNGVVITKPAEDALKLIKMWLKKEALLRGDESSESARPVLCEECIGTVFLDFLTNSTMKPESPKIFPDCSGNATPKEAVGMTTGTTFVHFLHWCTDHQELPKQACRKDVCAGGGYTGETQSHHLPMVALRAYSTAAVSLDLCHFGLPCDPVLHELNQLVTESEPVRIPIKEETMYKKIIGNLEGVKELLLRWTGVEDLYISGHEEPHQRYLVVTSTGRDWQRWFLEELLLQPWLPEAIEKGSLDAFLKPKIAVGES
ncbi:uncharacterized protein LOC135391172 [Ornithodoros turicata]|uniref:uncharacterized protein LOC135391172 n=1 Tax=Ornithodoros turicata TaxID=34597 RepID=UPI003139976F